MLATNHTPREKRHARQLGRGRHYPTPLIGVSLATDTPKARTFDRLVQSTGARISTDREYGTPQMHAFLRVLRDRIMHMIWNSGMSYDEIHQRGGPCPQTLNGWHSRETRRPQIDCLFRALIAIGKEELVLKITALLEQAAFDPPTVN